MLISRPLVYYSEMIGESELVLLGEESQEYVCLNGTSLAIWNVLDRPKSLRALLKELANIYQVSISDIEVEVCEFIEEMVAKSLMLALDSV